MHHRFLHATAAFLLILAAPAVRSDTPTKDNSAWWGHIKVLASDEFAGRLTGSAGYQKAAKYVADSFRRFGLAAAGENGFFQPVAYQVQRVLPDRSHVTLLHGTGREALSIGDDLVLSAGVAQRPDVSAPLVFVGYGIHLPEAGFDDFASLDVKGKIVVYVVGGPAILSGPQRAFAYSEKLPQYLEKAGAVGTIAITAPKNREVPWARVKAASVQPGMLLADTALRRFKKPMFAAGFNETVADKLLQGSGHAFSELVALADTHQPLPRFPLAASLEAQVVTETAVLTADNVIAELPGSDPALAGEAVVLSAHLDHLGTGEPDHGDGMFRGVMDDASGVASLLEVARAIHDSGLHPRRSILFVAVSGEEKGLLGSRYFAAHPTRHGGQLVADINMDMFLPLYPLSRVVGYGADESSLGDDVRAVGTKLGVDLVPDPLPDHLIFIRSDQYNFVRKGTPALMLTMQPRPGTAQEATFKAWFTERYHAQADNLDQPVDLAAADAYDRFLLALITRVADTPQPPAWKPESFFAEFARHPLP